MSTQLFAVSTDETVLTRLAEDVRRGLGGQGQKHLPSTYLYDDLGSTLFEAITLLPEYGLTRADTRLIERHARALAQIVGDVRTVAELGSGSGKKTIPILEAIGRPIYSPIDVSRAALDICSAQVAAYAEVRAVQASYLDGIAEITRERNLTDPMLVLFLGSTIGNFDPSHARTFLAALRSSLRARDFLLLGADLVKTADVTVSAYDDPLGVTAAFNRNVLVRINRELGANFDLPNFLHEARWNSEECRVEMHLRSACAQRVVIPGAGLTIEFTEGETIWTESSHKYTLETLRAMAGDSGFAVEQIWVDAEWPFAECLLRVV